MPVSTVGQQLGSWRAALWAVRLRFFLTGLLSATWVARTPTIKAKLDLDDAGLAFAFTGLYLGATLGLQLGKIITLRFGSRATLRATMPLFALALSGLALANNLAALTATVAVFAVANSVIDVAMSAHGIAVEKTSAQPLLSGIHAYHSLGMIAGALAGAAAERLQLSLGGHLAGITVAVGAAAVIGTRGLLPSTVDRLADTAPNSHTAQRFRPWPTRLIVLGSLAFCVALAEGAANDWTAVYLHDATGATTTVAALGFAVYSAAMFIGRLLGDRLVTAFGPARPYLAATLTAAVALITALLFGGTNPALVGIALFGLGISFTLPLIYSATATITGMPPEPSRTSPSSVTSDPSPARS
ncbi:MULTISPECIES: MFS transporter [unclassified Nocardia]|uniref:MFS transporter n=1 Tax=unclassified Nocardia TaxID=2637762 RepID=UPI001CE41A52|nr:MULTISPECIES: MFS transporter [unclassified Nocardia]